MQKGRWCFAVLMALFLAPVLPAGAQQAAGTKLLTLERLYAYPRLEGTAPVNAKWSQDSHKLAFLWNDKGMPFRDLWVYDAESGALRQVTGLEGPRDPWTERAADKDPKLKKHLPPDSGLGGFEWAPDSKQLAFAFRGELYLARAEGSRPALRLTRTEAGEAAPHFSPDSKKLAYISEHEVWVLDLETGERTQLTTGGSEDILNGESDYSEAAWSTLAWSPDGRWVAFLQTDRTGKRTRLIPNYVGTEVAVRKQRYSFAQDEATKLRLGVVPASGGAVTWLTPAERHYYNDWRWAPDSSRIVINRAEENWHKRHLDVVDIAGAVEGAKETKGGAFPWVRTIYTETDDKWVCTDVGDAVAWSPDSRKILFMSERDGWNHLYTVDADEGETVTVQVGDGGELKHAGSVRQLTRGAWQVEAWGADSFGVPVDLRPRFSPDGRRVYFTGTKADPSVRHLYWVEADGKSEPYPLTDSEGYNAAAVSPDERRIALIFSSLKQPWDLYVRVNAQGESWRRVTNSPLSEFAEYEWPQPRIVEFPGRDGKTVRALLFSPSVMPVDALKFMTRSRPGQKPPGPPASARVPVINFVHGAGYRQAVLNRWGGYYTPRLQFNQFLSQHGYAVIDVDYRGSSGYGRDWRTDVYLHLGGKDLEDELAAMDYLRQLAWVDADRAGMWGVSYGGFMTLMALFRSPGTFKAGSAWAAVSDWENYNRDYTQQRLRAPADEPEAYERSSPIHHVEGLQDHLQIIQGMVDDNVHFQDSVQLIDALVAAGKPFEVLIYPESSHGWSRPEVWLHSTRATFEFFERHLKNH